MPPEPRISPHIEGKSASQQSRTRIAKLAARQHGVLSARQLLALGLTRKAIDYRLRNGELHRIHAGVYAPGHAALTERGRWMAAVLAGGEGAALSHRHAAALAGFRETIATRIDVTVPRRRDSRRGLVFHQARLHPADRTTIDGIPVTAVPRTLLELAGQLAPREFETAFWEAERLGLIDVHDLRSLLARSHGRRGMTQLRRLADRMLPRGTVVRSPLERRFYELIRDSDLPLPAINVDVCGFEVDVFWQPQRLVVELDGETYHRGAGAALRDAHRDESLEAAGCRVLRVTGQGVDEEPQRVLDTVRNLLASH